MEEKVQYRGEEDVHRAPSNPPPYSSGPPPGPYGPPPDGLYGQTVHVYPMTNVGVVGTNVGIVGSNVGVVGTNVGVVGTNVGVVGAPVGVVPMVVAQQISPKPVRITCKSCHGEITTRIESKATTKTHFFACLLCLMGCWCCICIPYCTDACMNSDHYCPNCNAYIASYVP